MANHGNDHVKNCELAQICLGHVDDSVLASLLGQFLLGIGAIGNVVDLVVKQVGGFLLDCEIADHDFASMLGQPLGNHLVPDIGLVGVHVNEASVPANVLKRVVVAIRVFPQGEEDNFLNPVSAVEQI